MTSSFSLSRFWSIMGCTLILIFLLNIDYTAVNMTLVPISKELNIDLNILQWLLSAYVLIWGALVVPCGRLADLYGKKKMYLIGLCIFTFGSFILGVGSSIEVLILGRVIQGIGGALMSAPLYSIIFTTAPKHMQAFAIGVIASASGVGLSIGPPLSGWIIEAVGWRWIFLINVPLCLTVLALSIFIMPRDTHQKTDQKINYLVAFLLTAGLGIFIFGLNQFEIWGVSSPLLWFVILTGLTLLILFYTLDHRLEKKPQNQILPRSLLHHKPYLGVLYVSFAICYFFSLTLFAISLLLQNVYDLDISETGVFMLSFTAIMGILSPLSGRITDKVGLKRPIGLGVFLLLVGAACYLMILPSSPLIMTGTALFITGVGMSFLFSPLNTLMFRLVPAADMNTGAGLFTAAMMMGHTFAMIVVSSFLVYWGTYLMPGLLDSLNLQFSAEQQNQLISILGQAKHDTTLFTLFSGDEIGQAQHIVKDLYVSGLHANVALAMILISFSGFLLFKRLKNVNITDGDSTPEHIVTHG